MLPQTATVIPLFQIFGAVHLLDTQIAVILADAALLAPWATLILRPFFAAVPESLEESAALDGASQFRTFISVCVPIARNGAATVGTLVFMLSWGEFLVRHQPHLEPQQVPPQRPPRRRNHLVQQQLAQPNGPGSRYRHTDPGPVRFHLPFLTLRAHPGRRQVRRHQYD